MFTNYLKIALRNLLRNKGFSAINISGLAVGMASALLILLWIYNEVSFDRFHKNGPHIYQAWNRGVFDGSLGCWSSTPKVLGPALLEEYPEVERIARNYSRWFVTKAGDRQFSTSALITDAAFLQMFDFPLLQGDSKTALNATNSIVVTRKMALKMFGTEDALNKSITIDQDRFTVTGIMKDLPSNTLFTFEYILPWQYLKKLGADDSFWGNNTVDTYVQLKPHVDGEQFSAKIKDITIKHSGGEEEHEVFLHPISKWHLYSEFENGKISGGRIVIVQLFGVIAAFILIIACINFMNLSTARSEKRAKEVGVRKAAGASKLFLIGQFMGESIFITFISGTLALLIAYLCLPFFNTLVGKTLEVPSGNPLFWLTALAFIFITGIIAGSYPALFLSSFQPITILKGTFKKANAAVSPRKVLVVTQFTFAIILICCTLVVVQQIRHAQNRDTGYDRGQVVYHWITGTMGSNFNAIKTELLNAGVASSVTRTGSPLISVMGNSWGMLWKGKNEAEKIPIDRFSADEDLVKTAGLHIIKGRDMDLSAYPTDSSAMLINESAAKVMGFADPIGQTVKDGDQTFHIIGVVKDFVIRSPYERVRPVVIEGAIAGFNVIHIKFSSQRSTAENVKAMEPIFRRHNPDYPFEYHFLDQDYALKFEDTQRIATLTGLFAGLTIVISCLGLFGLAAYMAENRVKEIGVRKVLGASVLSIATLLSSEFVILVFIAIAIAVPVAWYAMDIWLSEFAYRIGVQWWTFALAGAMSILVSLLTVSYQAIRAALMNPVKSLRSE